MKDLYDCNLPVLKNTYEILLEESEDITYRMYDLFFKRHPELVNQFPCTRSEHPQIVLYLLCQFLERINKTNTKRIECAPKSTDKIQLHCIKPEHIPLFKRCLF